MPSGAKPMNHCAQLTSTPTVFLAMASAAAFGANAVKNIEASWVTSLRAQVNSQIVAPNQGVASELTLQLGARQLVLHAWPTAVPRP